MNLIVLIAFGFSGAAALIYEVAWTRSLALILGSTTYALSTMLSTFMAGLALGAWIGGKLADRGKNLLLLFGIMELGIGIFGLITIPLINSLSPFYFKIYRTFHLSPNVFLAIQFVLCAGVMLVPTTLMGATFPVISRKVAHNMDEIGRSVGNAYSFNTLGAIIGSFSAGFILIPFIGVKAAVITAASLNVAVSIVMIILSKAKIKSGVIAISITVLSVSLAAAYVNEEEKWLLNLYNSQRYKSFDEFSRSYRTHEMLFNKDYREGRVKLWKTNTGSLIIEVGGKIEGTDIKDIPNVLLLSYLPIASHTGPESFLNIGLGTGVTLSAAKDYIRDLSLVEINEGVIHAMSEFGPPELLNGVDVTINDARNYLLLTERRFDIISSEPSYPSDAPTANLFTKEFYEIAASRLNKEGVYTQWLPYYILENDDVTMMIKTFGAVFEHVFLWKTPLSLDLIMVGSKDPFNFNAEEIISRVGSLNKTNMKLPFVLSRNPEQIREVIKNNSSMAMNTDDRPLLEFHAAKNFIRGL